MRARVVGRVLQRRDLVARCCRSPARGAARSAARAGLRAAAGCAGHGRLRPARARPRRARRRSLRRRRPGIHLLPPAAHHTSAKRACERVHQLSFHRQRLTLELARKQLRGERRPHQPARAVRKRAVDVFARACRPPAGGPASPNGRRRALANPADFSSKGMIRSSRSRLPAWLSSRGSGIVVVDVEARADHAQRRRPAAAPCRRAGRRRAAARCGPRECR